MEITEQVWLKKHGALFLEDKQNVWAKNLEVGVYELSYSDMFGFYLEPKSVNFEFPYKVYGLETKLINRVLKYYNKTDGGNLGVLLNGLKGTGKTVTAKVLCNKLNLPVILVSTPFNGAQDYLNSFQQDIIIFIDEYEKIFKESSGFLTIMDGSLNSIHRRIFLLTTNTLSVDENLLDRPSRIRYLKKFGDLTASVIEEIVDDVLENPAHREDCIKMISTLEIITVDIVKAVLNEVNIHDESPMEFKDVFNVSVRTGKYKIFLKTGEGDKAKFDILKTNATISLRYPFTDRAVNDYFSINRCGVGTVVEVINSSTIVVNVPKKRMMKVAEIMDSVEEEEEYDDYEDDYGEIKEIPVELPEGKNTLIIETDYNYNESYKYSANSFANIF